MTNDWVCKSILLFQWIRCCRRNPPWGWSSATPDWACFFLLCWSFVPFSSSPAAPHLCFHRLFGIWLQRWPVTHWFSEIQGSADAVLTWWYHSLVSSGFLLLGDLGAGWLDTSSSSLSVSFSLICFWPSASVSRVGFSVRFFSVIEETQKKEWCSEDTSAANWSVSKLCFTALWKS